MAGTVDWQSLQPDQRAQYAQYLVDTVGEQAAVQQLRSLRVETPQGWVPDTERALKFQNQRRMQETLDETRRHNTEQEKIMRLHYGGMGGRGQADLYDVKQDDTGNYTYIPKDPRYGLPSLPVPSGAPGSSQLRKSPQMPQKTGEDLRTMSGLAQRGQSQAADFRPEYGGNFIMGDTENTVKRMFPMLENLTNTKGQADWWSAQEALNAFERHPLTGSTFTPTESGLWRQQAAGPRDDEQFIRENVERRAALMSTAIARAARAAAKQYGPDAVLAQTGLPMIPDESYAAPIIGKDALQQRVGMMGKMWKRPLLEELLGQPNQSGAARPR